MGPFLVNDKISYDLGWIMLQIQHLYPVSEKASSCRKYRMKYQNFVSQTYIDEAGDLKFIRRKERFLSL